MDLQPAEVLELLFRATVPVEALPEEMLRTHPFLAWYREQRMGSGGGRLIDWRAFREALEQLQNTKSKAKEARDA